jgi:hypothetical protein
LNPAHKTALNFIEFLGSKETASQEADQLTSAVSIEGTVIDKIFKVDSDYERSAEDVSNFLLKL